MDALRALAPPQNQHTASAPSFSFANFQSRIGNQTVSKTHSRRQWLLAMVFCGGLNFAPVADAATATLDGAYITRIEHGLDTLRSPNGRAWIAVDRTFTLPGSCLFSGTLNSPSGWMIELDTAHASFRTLLAVALTARWRTC